VKWCLVPLNAGRLWRALWRKTSRAFQVVVVKNNLPASTGHTWAWVWSLGWEDPLEEEMATHSSIFAWEIPWTEEPGGLQSIGSQRVGHDWSDLACTHKDFLIFCGLLGKSVESLLSGWWGPSSLPPRRPQSNPTTLSLPGWWHRKEVAGFLGVRERWEVMSPGAVLHFHLQLYILFRAVRITLQHLIQQP